MTEKRITFDVVSADKHPSADETTRRSFIASAALGAGATVVASQAQATPRVGGSRASALDTTLTKLHAQLDRAAVADLIQRERSARDQGHWDEMAACYHPESVIKTAWFKGTGAEFVAATRKNLGSGKIVSLHQLSPSVVTINAARALADTACQLVAFQDLDGVPVTHVGHVRLLWRAQKLGEQWLLMGLSVIYIRDYIAPCNPGLVPKIDEAEVAKYRLSYRYEAYMFAHMGRPTRDDLPGVDRPETVRSLHEADAAWLAGR